MSWLLSLMAPLPAVLNTLYPGQEKVWETGVFHVNKIVKEKIVLSAIRVFVVLLLVVLEVVGRASFKLLLSLVEVVTLVLP